MIVPLTKCRVKSVCWLPPGRPGAMRNKLRKRFPNVTISAVCDEVAVFAHDRTLD